MTVKQAYEVYALTGSGYARRDILGYAWTKEQIAEITRAYSGPVKVSNIHVININGAWHRINAQPLPIEGVEADGIPSPLGDGYLPRKEVPAMYLIVEGRNPRWLGQNLDKTISFIQMQPPDKKCVLTTKREGGMPDVVFTVTELWQNEDLQQQVWTWLTKEMEARK